MGFIAMIVSWFFRIYASISRAWSSMRLINQPGMRPKLIGVQWDLPQLPLVVIMTAYNNKEYVKRSLESVLGQAYDRYMVIYIDDCSTDGSFEVAQEVVNKYPQGRRVTLIKNDVRKGKLANIYNAIHTAEVFVGVQGKPSECIVVEVDGDDYLSDIYVLGTINTVYQKTGALIVYGAYENYKQDRRDEYAEVFSQATPLLVKASGLFRKYPWVYSGVRTYHVELFKQIKREDLCTKHPRFEGQFFPVSHDAAMFYPMLEMAGERVAYIQQSLLRRNIDSPINDYKVYSPEIRKELREEIARGRSYCRL